MFAGPSQVSFVVRYMSNILFGIPSTCARRTLHFNFGKNRGCNECRSIAEYADRIAICVAIRTRCVFENGTFYRFRVLRDESMCPSDHREKFR